MIKDPAIQAIVNGGTGHFLTRRQRVERYILWALVVAVFVLGFGYIVVNGVAHQAQSASSKASASVQASCQFWHDLAVLPTTPQTTVTGYRIIADSYVAYAGLNCVTHAAALPHPSQNVIDQIPPILRAEVLSNTK